MSTTNSGGHATRVSFSVTVHVLRPGESVGVCVAEEGTPLDPSHAVHLLQALEPAASGGSSVASTAAAAFALNAPAPPVAVAGAQPGGAGVPGVVGVSGSGGASSVSPMPGLLSPSAAAATTWHSIKPLSLQRTSKYQYKYCLFSASGAFLHWETLPGTREARPLHLVGKLVTVEDTFGEMEDDYVQRRLDETVENTRQEEHLKARQATEKLRSLFGPHRKLMIVTYSLPVVLRRDPSTKAWSASWIEDDFLARTPNSIAHDVNTTWIGVVTRECIDVSTSEEWRRPRRTHSVCVDSDAVPDLSSPQPHGSPDAVGVVDDEARGFELPSPITCIIPQLTAGGVTVDELQAGTTADSDTTPRNVSVRVPNPCAPMSTPCSPNVDSGPSSSPPASCGRACASHLTRDAAEAARPDTSSCVLGPARAGDASAVPAAGATSAEEDDDSISITFSSQDMLNITKVLNEMNVVPIFLPTDLHEGYACYCMSVLKPCLHNVLETGSQRLFPYAASLSYLSEGWQYYLKANELISKVVHSQYTPGDVVWIHDYQLCMLPRYMVRHCTAAGQERPPQVFFMHSPFPTSEIFRTLSVRNEILRALLECDVVGFHTFNYARHFLQASKRLLGHNFQSQRGGSIALDVEGRDVMVAISHVGVEAQALDRWMASEQAAHVARLFAERYKGKIIIAGIDTCQRLSGVALKLLAFERLLEENPVYRHKVVLVQRCEMRQTLCADMKRTSAELRERVARIRNTYGDVIDYEEAASYSPTFRVGLFHRADILLQTPIREGLNLLPLEYVYVRTQWQIQRSKAYSLKLEEEARLALAQADAASQAGSCTTADTTEDSEGARARGADADAAAIGDAAMKALTAGMPGYYATLAAPPSSMRNKRHGDLKSMFRPLNDPDARAAANLAPLPPSNSAAASTAPFGSEPPQAGGDALAAAPTAAIAGSTQAASLAGPVPDVTSGEVAAARADRAALSGTTGALMCCDTLLASLPRITTAIATVPANLTAAALARPSLPSLFVPKDAALATQGGAGSSDAATGRGLNTPGTPSVDADGGFDPATLVSPLPPPLRGGCVMLSEFSTASHILNSNLVVNPWSIRQVAKDMDKALCMPDHERSFRQWRDYQYAIRNPAASWSRSVLSDVLEVYAARATHDEHAAGVGAPPQPGAAAALAAGAESAVHTARAGTPLSGAPPRHVEAAHVRAPGMHFGIASVPGGLSALQTPSSTLRAAALTVVTPSCSTSAAHAGGVRVLPVESLLHAYHASSRCLIVLDYGGTIMTREMAVGKDMRADLAGEGYSRHAPMPLLDALAELSMDPRITMYVVSGLRSAAIDALHLSHMPYVGLAAENGMLVSHPSPVTALRAMEAARAPSSGAFPLGDSPASRASAPTPSVSTLVSPTTRDLHNRAQSAGGALAFELQEMLGSPGHASTGEPRGPMWPMMGSAPAHTSQIFRRSSGIPATMTDALDVNVVHEAVCGPIVDASARRTASGGGSSTCSGPGGFVPAASSPPRQWTALATVEPDKVSEWQHVKARAMRIMNEYQWRVNGSVVRAYDYVVAWDFRNADVEWAQPQAKFLTEDLDPLASNMVRVSLRQSRVEVSLRTMNKGKFIHEVLKSMGAPPDFILVAGDDATDEEMFAAVDSWKDAQSSAAARSATQPVPDAATTNASTASSASATPAPGGGVRSISSVLRDARQPASLRLDLSTSPSAASVSSMTSEPSTPVPGPAVFTVHVGRSVKRTRAGYFLPDVGSMQRLLLAMHSLQRARAASAVRRASSAGTSAPTSSASTAS